uniref:E3 UFM1-protein ligase 1 homolog n=1 Tax=Panagrolaimus sp. PS1159 TaxID=55785 RepID=A0AC35FTW4_9BILA
MSWAEIQKLAADLQRIQSTEAAEKLSDSNCVEIISRLISTKLIDVVFTCDGKEYITRKHLITEIKHQCAGADGRIAITTLAQKLNVDLKNAENGVNALVKSSPNAYIISAGELITAEFIENLCIKLNKLLEDVGQLSILYLTNSWNIPIEFLNQHVIAEVGKKVHAVKDGDQLFTTKFIEQQKDRLLSATYATTYSVPLSAFFEALNIPETLFMKILNELISNKQLSGEIAGSKNSLKSFYVPEVQSKLVKKYIRDTILSQRFISNDTLKKMNVPINNTFFSKILSPSECSQLMYLPNIVLLKDLYNQIFDNVQEIMKDQNYCSVENVINNIVEGFEEEDNTAIIENMIKENKDSTWYYPDGASFIFNDIIIQKAKNILESFIVEEATRIVPEMREASKDQKTKGNRGGGGGKEDDEDWGSGSKGKKKGGKKPASKKAASTNDSDILRNIVAGYSLEDSDIISKLEASSEIPPKLVNDISDAVMGYCNDAFRKQLEIQYFAGGTNIKESKNAVEGCQKKVTELYNTFCIFDQGTSLFDEILAADLQQYLLKSIGNEIASTVLRSYSDIAEAVNLTPKIRDECIQAIDDGAARKTVKDLFDSLNNVETFHDVVNQLNDCGLRITSPDKKTREQLIRAYINEYKHKLEILSDPPSELLAFIIAFIGIKTNNAVHASGKFVAPMIKKLSDICSKDDEPVPSDVIDKLIEAQRLVICLIKKKDANDEDSDRVKFNNIMSSLKKEYID